MKIPAFIWVVPACIALSGCNAMVGKIFLGIDKPRLEPMEAQKRFIERLGIEADQMAFLSDSAFKQMDRQTYKEGFSSGFRPIQIRIFDSEGKNLRWQYSICEGRSEPFFSTFPPTNIWPVKDTLFTLEDELNTLENPAEPLSKNAIADQKMVMVVYWAKYLGKPSKWILKAANDYKKQHAGAYLILVNIGCPSN